MKIERISDNQVKFILNHSDLAERDIRVNELAYGSQKAQELFREMMEAADTECDFQADNTPLMIEAIPVSSESIMIIVTKVTNSDVIDNKFSLLPRSKEASKFKKKQSAEEVAKPSAPSTISIFSFKNLDDITNVSVRLFGVFEGASCVYKEQSKYFLILENEPETKNNFDELEAVLSEYGQKHVSTQIAKFYIIEHGEPIVKNDAVGKLANI